jgi:hypothetical protein
VTHDEGDPGGGLGDDVVVSDERDDAIAVRDESTITRREREELAELGRLSHYLDELFVVPGTSYRVGLDPILGLVPGIGDVAASTAAAYIVARAAALGVPRATLARMVLVLVVDAVFGSLPLVGDVFDAGWKANRRNVRLLESRLDDPPGEVRDRRYVLVVTLGLTLLLLGVSVGVVLAAWWLLGRAGVV